jgi:cell division protein ZapA (FtsZ GTPase activity inhibitor)
LNIMEPNETVLLTVTIDGRQMRLRVTKHDEEQVLSAVELLNKRIAGFQRFGSSDPMDRLSWAALDLAGEVVRGEKPTDAEPNERELTEIEQLLDSL